MVYFNFLWFVSMLHSLNKLDRKLTQSKDIPQVRHIIQLNESNANVVGWFSYQLPYLPSFYATRLCDTTNIR